MNVRVRYAPSPTGFQHIGGIRTALINYLYAHGHKGSFIVRVEDTDITRSQEIYLEDLYSSLEWLGIVPDESPNIGGEFEPYIQSQRFTLYQKYAQQLIDQGDAYYCFTSPIKQSDEQNLTDYQYNRSSRDLSHKDIQHYRTMGILPTIRLKIPLEGQITFEDELLGNITRDLKDVIIDPILLKSDGYPTYHLANVVDDYHMKITNVMRSQEWIPSTPVHVYLYKVFGWQSPKFCHLPMVLGEDGQKLSKRNGSITVKDLRALGILPEALINCIALLGWSFDDSREFFTKQELENLYSQGKLNKAPAKFSISKLRWFNAHYIRLHSKESLAKLLLPYFIAKNWLSHSQEDFLALQQLVPLIQERLEVLSDATNLLKCVFEEVNSFDFKSFIDKHGIQVLKEGLIFSQEVLLNYWNDSVETQEEIFRTKLKEHMVNGNALKLGQVLMPLRIAITGESVSPPVLSLIKLINKNKIMNQIEKALLSLKEKN